MEGKVFYAFLIFAGLCGLAMWGWARAIHKMEDHFPGWSCLVWLAGGEAVVFLGVVYVLMRGSAVRSWLFLS